MNKRFEASEDPSIRKSPFHLPDGQLNPACVPAPRGGWQIDWTTGKAHQRFASDPTVCSLCHCEFKELNICFGGFCHYRFVCSGCSVPTQRLACYKCRHTCKREPGCGNLAEVVTRVTCVKCWEVNIHYEDRWEIEQVLWFWAEVEKEVPAESEESE